MKRQLQILLLLIPVLGFAQKPDLHKKADALNLLSKSFWYTSPDSTIFYANQALQLSRKSGYIRGQAEAYNNLGVGNYFNNDYEKVLNYYRQSIKNYEEIDDKQGLASIANIFYRLSKYEKALENYLAALQLSRKEKDLKRTNELLLNIGDVYQILGNDNEALKYFGELKSRLEQQKHKMDLSLVINRIADIHYNRGNYQLAFTEYKQLLKRCKSTGEHTGQSIALNQIATIQVHWKAYDAALRNYTSAYLIQHGDDDIEGMAVCLLNMAEAFSTLHKYDKSKEMANRILNLDQEQISGQVKAQTFLLLANNAEKQNKFKSALKYHQQYSTQKEQLERNRKTEEMTNTLVLYELGQKKQENDILHTRNENFRLRLEKQHLTTWRLVFGFTIFIILGLVLFIYYRYFQKKNENWRLEKQITKALKKQEEQQQIIVHQSSLTSLGELAAGIAHEINQPMQNISLSTETIQMELREETNSNPMINESIGEIFEDIQRVREIVDHIRIFSSGQKEGVYEAFSPNDSIKKATSMVKQQFINHGIALSLHLSNQLHSAIGNPHKFEQVMINLINNAKDAVKERSASATDFIPMTIEIKTFNLDDQIIVQVRDNGIGIPPDKQTDIFLPFFTTKQLGQGTGLGLSISHGIISDMKGQITVENINEGGTLMQIRIPSIVEN